MKFKDVVEIGVGVAAPVILVSAVMGSAPVSGAAALTWALKRIGFGCAKRSAITLGATSMLSSKAAGATVDFVENKIDEVSKCTKSNQKQVAVIQ